LSKLTLNGYSQEVAGLDSYAGSNSAYTLAVVDDAAGGWGATTFGAGVNYPGLAPERVVLGLGDFRFAGANNRLPTGARLVLNTATATATAALRLSKLTLNGYSQEVAGLDSYAGSNSAYTLAVVGGAATSSNLVVNTPELAVSSYAGALGGAGVNENHLSLEKKGEGTLNLTGTLSYTGATVVSGGTLAIGSGVGALGTASLTVEAGAKLTDGGALVLPPVTILRRSTVSGGASVQVTGALTLGGTLTVELPGYTPVLGDVIPLLSAGSVSGSFAAVVVPRLSSGLAYRLESGATAVNLRVVGTSFDATLYRAGLLSATASVSEALITADSDGDGLPNLLDYALGGSLSAFDAGPAGDFAGGQLRLTFTREPRVSDVTLQVEATSELDAGPWILIAENIQGAGWTGSARVSETPTGEVNRKQVTVTDPGTGPRRFLRLRAVYQP
jgi:autotransporter-associated beta strand protein